MKRWAWAVAAALLLSGCPGNGGVAEPAEVEIQWPDAGVPPRTAPPPPDAPPAPPPSEPPSSGDAAAPAADAG